MKLSMYKIFTLLALATIGISAIACTSASTPASGGTATDTTGAADTAKGADGAATTDTAAAADMGTATDTTGAADTGAAADTGTVGDSAAADTGTVGDGAAAGKGCTAEADKTFVAGLADPDKGKKFLGDVTNCALAQMTNKDEADAIGKISKCLVETKANPVSMVCAGCYGLRAYCTLSNCVNNP
ncbi:MAG: hypothetical protein EXR77_05805, partial [Myxococcales bacterium]|nr:hypothetical protein [Myxococcales bacterium]